LTSPLDLRLTLGVQRAGGRDPTIRVGDRGAWLARPTPEGPASLLLERRADTVHATGFGPGGPWLERLAPALLGELDEPAAFQPQDPVLADAVRRAPGLRLSAGGAPLASVVATILAQRITSGEAIRQWRDLCRALSVPAPGPPGLLMPPSAEALRGRPSWWFHRLGIERRRAEAVIRAARHEAHLDRAARLDPDAAQEALMLLPGIGPWTAATAVARMMVAPDAVVIGDYHLPHVVSHALAGEPRGGDDRMLDLLEPYRGQRARVVRLLVAAGHRAPAFGPHRAILPIAGW
jgi:3-methyladenine DNA glycosylase/8-oxoguanine DNA glycosylase